MRVVVESPLAGDVEKNKLYTLWCCRALYEDGYEPLASHLFCPQYMDDNNREEREDGIGWGWAWLGDEHWFFIDLGISNGMQAALDACLRRNIPMRHAYLKAYKPFWDAFCRGDLPPATKGFLK